MERDLPWKGVAGRILLHDQKRGWLVQAGRGLIWLSEVESTPPFDRPLRVGQRLGFAEQDEIFRLREQLDQLEARVARLEQDQ